MAERTDHGAPQPRGIWGDLVFRILRPSLMQAWDDGVDAAFLGAVARQKAEDVKRHNPYRTRPIPPEVSAE